MQCTTDQSIYIEQSVHPDKSIIQPQSILLNAKINQKRVQSSPYVQSEQQSIYFNQSVSSVQSVNEPQPVISNPIVNTIISFTPKQKHVQSIPFVQSVHDILSTQNVQPNANNQSVPQVCPETSINLVKPVKAKSFSIKKHRRGKRNSIRLFSKPFKWVGNNIAGAKSKWASVKRWVRIKTPAILSLQETKFQTAGRHNLDGYFSYEHLRTEKTAGGGIYMAVKKELNPALVRDGGEEVEALAVDIFVKKMGIACITAYGPQENDLKGKKATFWRFLEEEAKRADIQGKGYILQGDLNAWLGDKIIAKDPRKQNENGKLMEIFLKENNLTVVNGLDLCKGVFTRIQKRQGVVVKGILDFFVVCNRIISLITGMEIDDMKKNVPTNYTQVRKGGRAVDSDHVPLELTLDMKIPPTRPTRVVVYNFNNKNGQNLFKQMTGNTEEFTNCFISEEPLLVQCDMWKKVLEAHCKKSISTNKNKKGKD